MFTWTLPITYTGIALVQMTALLAVSTHQTSLSPLENAPQRQLGAIPAVLEELGKCESGGRYDAVNFNDGAPGLHSRGLLQFQYPTFRHEWRRLINKDIEDEEIHNLWTDPEAQLQLATEMLLESPKNLRHWRICTDKHNLYQKLTNDRTD